jgi:hypothetical protein
MAALQNLSLIVNINDPGKTGLLQSFNTSVPATLPVLSASDTVQVSLRTVQPSTVGTQVWQDVDVSADATVLAIGNYGTVLTGGAWPLTFSGNTASGLAYNITASALATALNALASIISAGGVTVATGYGNGVFAITFNNNGTQAAFTSGANTLTPGAQALITTVLAGSGSTPCIQVVQLVPSLLALCESWSTFASAAAVITNLQTGTSSVPSVQQVALVPVPYAGSFQLTTSILTTGAIPFNASASSVQAALNTGGYNYVVTGPPGGPWQITTVANGAVAAITAAVTGLTVPVGQLGTLTLKTLNLFAAFAAAGSPASITAILCVQITPSGSGVATVLQIPVTIQQDLIQGSTLVPVPE